MIAFLSLLYIFIARDNGQRFGYLTTMMLTQVTFMTLMTGFVPVARENPRLQLLFFYLVFAQFCCIISAVLILWLTRLAKKGKFQVKKVDVN